MVLRVITKETKSEETVAFTDMYLYYTDRPVKATVSSDLGLFVNNP